MRSRERGKVITMTFEDVFTIIEDLAVNKNEINTKETELPGGGSRLTLSVDGYKYLFVLNGNQVIGFERL